VKAAFGAEAIGLGYADNVRAMTAGIIKDPINRLPWVAEITGLDDRYKYARRFLPHKTDLREASSTRNRGVMFWWTLDPGKLYQAYYRTSWRSGYDRPFLTVSDDGEIIELSESEARRWLSDHSELTS
jgi:hypothetical protein